MCKLGKLQSRKKELLILFFLLIVCSAFIPKLNYLTWRVFSIGEFRILAVLSKFVSDSNDTTGGQQAYLASHRGVLKENVARNSDRSIILASQNKFRFIEIDVSFSKDYIPFIFHDSNLKFKTNIDKLTSEVSWNEIKKLKLPDGQRILNLQHFFSEYARLFDGVILDIKTDDDNIYEKAYSFIDVVNNSKYFENIFVIGRAYRVLSKIKKLNPKLKVGCEDLGLLYNYMSGKDLISLNHPTQFSMLEHYFAIKLNLVTIIWTINSPKELTKLKNLQNTIILTDLPNPNFRHNRNVKIR